MKIGVVGLLPEQAQQLRQRHLDHDLHFLPRDREKDVGTFAESMTKVIITTKFTGHHATYAVPAHKRVLGYNSVSGIGRYLNTLPKPGQVATTNFVKDVPHTLIRLEGEGPFEWSTYFAGVQPTDVLRFEYDAKADKPKLLQSISNARSYQRKHAQVDSKMRHGKTDHGTLYTDVTILSVKGETKRPQPVVEAPAPEMPAETAVEPMSIDRAEYEAECRDLYRKTLIARASLPHSSVEQAAADASRAVDYFRKQFPFNHNQ